MLLILNNDFDMIGGYLVYVDSSIKVVYLIFISV